VVCWLLLVDHLAYIRLLAGITLAWQPGAASAADLIVPRQIGMIFADPTDAEADRTVLYISS